jgi:serine/threonine protein kinase
MLEDKTKKYLLRTKIGFGITCECYTGNEMEGNSEIYAIKIFDPKFHEFYSNEISLLSKLNENKNRNNNIIKLYGYGQGILTPFNNENNMDDNIDDNKDKKVVYYQVLEYAVNGELKDYVNDTKTRIPENVSAKLFFQIVQGVKYLHDNNIAHCDIKPENVLLDKNFNAKLNDFGFSQKFSGEKGDYILHQFSGSKIYCSPETKLAYTKGFDGIKNDIFSLGVLLFGITIGNFPFQRTSYSDEKYKFIIKKNYKRFWEFFDYIEITEEFKDLINNLICVTPSQRLSIEQILAHPWLTQNLGQNYISQNNELCKFDNNDFIDQIIFDEFNSRKKV